MPTEHNINVVLYQVSNTFLFVHFGYEPCIQVDLVSFRFFFVTQRTMCTRCVNQVKAVVTE